MKSLIHDSVPFPVCHVLEQNFLKGNTLFLPEYFKPQLESFFQRWAGSEGGRSKECYHKSRSLYFHQKSKEQASHREHHMQEVSATAILLRLSMALHNHTSLTAGDQPLYLPLTTAQQHSSSSESARGRVCVQIPTDQFFQSPMTFTMCTVHTALQTQSHSSWSYHHCYAAPGEDKQIC